MIVNIIQRPELTDMYMLQRQISLDLGLRVTLALRVVHLNNPEIIEMVKKLEEGGYAYAMR